jgi:hypothetical protein
MADRWQENLPPVSRMAAVSSTSRGERISELQHVREQLPLELRQLLVLAEPSSELVIIY